MKRITMGTVSITARAHSSGVIPDVAMAFLSLPSV
jgi:hypothetical protein